MGNKSFLKKIIVIFAFVSLLFSSMGSVFAACCGGEEDGFWFNNCCYGCSSWDPIKMGKDCPYECCTRNATDCPIKIPCTGELCDDDDGDDDDDPKPTCERCTLGSCPAPLLGSGSDEYIFEDFLYCKDEGDGCTAPTEHWADCFENPSAQPIPSLVIYPESKPTTYGFISSTHTGAGKLTVDYDDSVNEPIRMVGTYVDTTSAEIEAMYVWFTPTSMPTTPKYVDLNGDSGQAPKTANNYQFGFMMHRENNTWKPYIPSIVGSSAGDKWVKATDYNSSTGKFNIIGSNGTVLLTVTLPSTKVYPKDSNKMVMDFTLTFNTSNPVRDGGYNIFMMGNDTFGFTPYDNYDAYPAIKSKIGDYWAAELIRYFDEWIDSNRDWSVDLNAPFFASKNVTVTGKSNLTFSWDIRDNLSLYGIVGNLYIDENFDNVLPFITSVSSGGSVEVETPYTPIEKDDSPTKTGYLGDNYLFKILGTDGTGTATIDVGENREGIIYLYITGFDRGGNPTESSFISFDLRDWLATQGGFVYSRGGIDVTSRTIANTSLWDPIALISKFNPVTADVSSELEADSLTVAPVKPDKSDFIDSYMVRPYEVEDLTGGYYSILKNAFEKKKDSLNVSKLNGSITTLSGTLVTNSSTNIRYMERTGNLTVTDFLCNGRGIFFITGDLIIDGKITNSNANKDACIFVVKENVIIKEGGHVSGTLDNIRYEPINAYIFSDKSFTIEEESTSWPTTDGLYIGGGIHSLTGISLERYLNLGNRLQFPVFVVDHHSKYGVFAGDVFGSNVNVQKVEVGFKPS